MLDPDAARLTEEMLSALRAFGPGHPSFDLAGAILAADVELSHEAAGLIEYDEGWYGEADVDATCHSLDIFRRTICESLGLK